MKLFSLEVQMKRSLMFCCFWRPQSSAVINIVLRVLFIRLVTELRVYNIEDISRLLAFLTRLTLQAIADIITSEIIVELSITF